MILWQNKYSWFGYGIVARELWDKVIRNMYQKQILPCPLKTKAYQGSTSSKTRKEQKNVFGTQFCSNTWLEIDCIINCGQNHIMELCRTLFIGVFEHVIKHIRHDLCISFRTFNYIEGRLFVNHRPSCFMLTMVANCLLSFQNSQLT